MKRLIGLIFMLVMIIPTLVLAAPFLICDPQTNVTHYVITGSINVTVLATPYGNGTVRLEYDLAGISMGNHNVEVKAKNIWGESVAVPFVFSKQVPEVPETIRIE